MARKRKYKSPLEEYFDPFITYIRLVSRDKVHGEWAYWQLRMVVPEAVLIEYFGEVPTAKQLFEEFKFDYYGGPGREFVRLTGVEINKRDSKQGYSAYVILVNWEWGLDV